MKFKAILAAALVAGFAHAAPASAASTVRSGVLDCTVAPGVGFIIGSSKRISCIFKGQGRVERYTGSTGKLGIDIGVTNKAHLAWVVFAPSSVRRWALSGTYVGASAQATVGAGLGANVLIGGWNKSISLQPISVQGQTGLNIAGGLASLTLRPAGHTGSIRY